MQVSLLEQFFGPLKGPLQRSGNAESPIGSLINRNAEELSIFNVLVTLENVLEKTIR